MTASERTRDQYLQRKYGITTEVYEKMFLEGDKVCWICCLPPKKRRLAVDHDHSTGQVRGLLCFLCNKKMIGRAKKAHAWKFRRAALYLESPRDWRL